MEQISLRCLLTKHSSWRTHKKPAEVYIMAQNVSGPGQRFDATQSGPTKKTDSSLAGVENFFKKLGTTVKRTVFLAVGWLLAKLGKGLTNISKAFTNDKTFLTDAGKSVANAGKKLTQKAQPPLKERFDVAGKNLANKAQNFCEELRDKANNVLDGIARDLDELCS